MGPRVVVSGAGAVTVFGTGLDCLEAALLRGRSGVHPLRGVPVARGKNVSAQVEDPRYDGPGRVARMLIAAVDEAVARSGLRRAELAGAGLFVATTAGDSRDLEDDWGRFAVAEQADGALRSALHRFAPWALADEVAAHLGCTGPRVVVSNACASGNLALFRALSALRLGHVERAVVCGADQLKATTYWGAERSGFLGHDLRPFHRDRDGSVLGDGAAALVLELESAAAARCAPILAELAGAGVTCDEDPKAIVPQLDGGAQARAIRTALHDAATDPEEVDLLDTHGTGTVAIDRLETMSCKLVFGEHARAMCVVSTKSLTGHLSAASPIVEAIACLIAIRSGWVHPTAGLDAVDPELDLDYVPLTGRERAVGTAVSSSIGGGGTNAVVVLRKHPRTDPAGRAEMPPHVPVAVMGVGAATALGCGVAWVERCAGAEQMGAGADLVRRVASADVRDVVPGLPELVHLSRTAQLTAAAAWLAVGDAGGAGALPAAERIGVVIGTAFGGTPAWSALLCPRLDTDPTRITPSMALDHGPHLGVTLVARLLGVRGVTATLTSGRVAGLQAIAMGADLIRLGLCDVAVVGGSDSLDDALLRGVRLLGCLDPATAYGEVAPTRAMGEGAACLVLARGDRSWPGWRTPRATLAGHGSGGSAAGLGGVSGVEVAMRSATHDALRATGVHAKACVRSDVARRALGDCLAAGPVLDLVAAVVASNAAHDSRTVLAESWSPGGAVAAVALHPCIAAGTPLPRQPAAAAGEAR